jgi:transposase
VAEFQTTVRGLLAFRDWLKAHRVTQVAMEATGVYWKPVWAILEDEFDCLLVNARHVKQVPGRKTDVTDAAWLCQLLEAGLLQRSFVPPKPIRVHIKPGGTLNDRLHDCLLSHDETQSSSAEPQTGEAPAPC